MHIGSCNFNCKMLLFDWAKFLVAKFWIPTNESLNLHVNHKNISQLVHPGKTSLKVEQSLTNNRTKKTIQTPLRLIGRGLNLLMKQLWGGMSVNPPNTRRNNWKETLTPIPTRGVYKQSAKQFSPKSTIPWHCADCWCLHMLSCTHFSLKAVYVKWTTPQKTILPCGNAKVQRLKAYDLIARPKNKKSNLTSQGILSR